MDDDVCAECGASTDGLTSTLELEPAGRVTRRWRECRTCGWESPYADTVTR